MMNEIWREILDLTCRVSDECHDAVSERMGLIVFRRVRAPFLGVFFREQRSRLVAIGDEVYDHIMEACRDVE